MIIVSGEPRSGTSLMMDTIRLLGIPVWGYEQPSEIKGSYEELTLEQQLRRDRAKDLNDKFWEVGGIVMQGLSPETLIAKKLNVEISSTSEEEKARIIRNIDFQLKQIDAYKDHAVKIIWNGLIKTDYSILQSSKIILCLRDPYHVAKSQMNLETSIKVAEEVNGEKVMVSVKAPMTPMRYLHSASAFVNWLQQPVNQTLNILKIDYDDMQFKPRETIEKIVRFLNLTSDIEPAIANIDPSKRRSAIDLEPTTEKEEWLIVREIYEALKTGEFEVVRHRIANYNEFQRNNPENVKWLDEETFFVVTPALYRDMLVNTKLLDGMIASKVKREEKGLLCTSCPLFNRTGSPYVTALPYDFEDLVRPRVKCKELGEVTMETCQNHWQSIQYDPKRLTAQPD